MANFLCHTKKERRALFAPFCVRIVTCAYLRSEQTANNFHLSKTKGVKEGRLEQVGIFCTRQFKSETNVSQPLLNITIQRKTFCRGLFSALSTYRQALGFVIFVEHSKAT